jgi:hypothetical protein
MNQKWAYCIIPATTDYIAKAPVDRVASQCQWNGDFASGFLLLDM